MENIGWLLFFERTIGNLAWPIAATVVALAFRKEVADLMRRLKALKLSGAEVGFSELLDEASRDAASIKITASPETMREIDEDTIAKHPHFAIIEAWRSIETQIVEIVAGKDPDIPRHKINGFQSFRTLRQLGLIEPEVLSLIEDLRRIRNAAVHDSEPDITKGQAIEYLALAGRVEVALKKILTNDMKD